MRTPSSDSPTTWTVMVMSDAGPPYETDATPSGYVTMRIPITRAGHRDVETVAMSPEKARSQAEALNIAASDAERRREDMADGEDGEMKTDGGGYPYTVTVEASTEVKLLADGDDAAEDRAVEKADVPDGWSIMGVFPSRLATDGGVDRPNCPECGGHEHVRSLGGFSKSGVIHGEDGEPVADAREEWEAHRCDACDRVFAVRTGAERVETDGGVDAMDPDAVDAIPEDELERWRKRKDLFTCPMCGEVADARVDVGVVTRKFHKAWMDLHRVTEMGGESVYVHVSEDEVDRGASFRRLMERHAPEDAEPDPHRNPDPERPGGEDGPERPSGFTEAVGRGP